MKGFCVWFAATLALGWYFDLLGRTPDPVKLALVLAPWLLISGVAVLLRDLSRVEKGEAHRPDGRGASNTSASTHSL